MPLTQPESGSVAQPIPIPQDQQQIASVILHRALIDSVWGKPMLCDVRQTITFGSRKMSGFGKYLRGGQGSGRLKMELVLPAGDRMNNLLQISNGELMHTIQTLGDNVQRTRVDLGKVRERMGTITTESLDDPVIAMYLAIGGQSELLRKLAQQYRWDKVTKGNVDGIPVWWLTGTLSAEPPPVHALAPIDVRLFQPHHSGLSPTQVIAAISRKEAKYPFWLLQVEQSRPPGETTPIGNGGGIQITTEWANAAEPKAITLDVFERTLSNDPFTEETAAYLPPGPIVSRPPSMASTSTLQR